MQVGAFSVLKELVVVLPNCLADHIGSLIPGIEKALNVSNIRKIFFLSLVTQFLLLLFILSLFCFSGQIIHLKFEDRSPDIYTIGIIFAFSGCFPSLYQGNKIRIYLIYLLFKLVSPLVF